jgi:hypothetical protein
MWIGYEGVKDLNNDLLASQQRCACLEMGRQQQRSVAIQTPLFQFSLIYAEEEGAVNSSLTQPSNATAQPSCAS